MPTIQLTQGQRARVDWADYRELAKRRWYAQWDKDTRTFYAARVTYKGGVTRVVQMHRQILGLEHGDRRQVDHWNHDTVDNRRENIRACSPRENQSNRRDQSSYGVGVFKHGRRRSNPFEAHARAGGKRHHLGYFATAEEAREARRRFLEDQQ